MPNAIGSDEKGDRASIEIKLSKLQQLFNSLDPSPFHERDLDSDAEEYIVGSADELPLQTPLQLVIHLPVDQLQSIDPPDLARAIHNYFAYRLSEGRRRLRVLFRDGRVALLIGLAFLVACMALRQVLLAVASPATVEIPEEGLLIVGWVAMWRPLEIFLYDWWPIRRRCRVFAKLAEIPVVVRAT